MPEEKVYAGVIDILDPDGDWTIEPGVAGSHVKKTKPRAGGGTIIIDMSDTEKAELEKFRATLNVKYGQKSKMGNISAPLRLVEAYEKTRLDTLGAKSGIYDDFDADLVYGNIARTSARTVANSLQDDGTLDIAEFVTQALPLFVRDMDGTHGVVDALAIELGHQLHLDLEGIGHIKDLVGRFADAVRWNFPTDYPSLRDPATTGRHAQKVYKQLQDPYTQRMMQSNADMAGAEGLIKPQEKPKRGGSTKPGKPKRGKGAAAEGAEGGSGSKADAFGDHMSGGKYGIMDDVNLDSEITGKSKWMTDFDRKEDAYENRIRLAAEGVRHHGGYGSTLDRNTKWGSMVILEHSKTKVQPAKVRGRANKPSEMGRVLRHPYRITTDKRVFSAKRSGVEGTVLVDISGSMSLDTDDITRIMEILPASTVACYSGPYTPGDTSMFDMSHAIGDQFGGALQVIARNNRMADLRYLWSIPNHVGGGSVGHGNIVDGPALLWLSKQKGPRYWVCDGYVTGIYLNSEADGGHPSYDYPAGHLSHQAADFTIRNKILRLDSMGALQHFIETRAIKYAR